MVICRVWLSPAGFGLAAVSCGGVSGLVVRRAGDCIHRAATGRIIETSDWIDCKKRENLWPSRVKPNHLAKVKTELNNPRSRHDLQNKKLMTPRWS